MDKLQKKVVWITGSGRGIGKAAAVAFAGEGAQVVVSSRSPDEIKAVVSEIKQAGFQALAIPCDVSQNDQVENLTKHVIRKFGKIDILVNNAGLGLFSKIIETNEEDWEAMMNVNVKGAFLCSQAVLPHMINNSSGHIINVVSVAGKQPFSNCGGYCASKYAMLGFTDVLRLETRNYGIKVTAFLPGATNTAIWGDADVNRSKMMRPGEVAQVIVSICLDGAGALQEEVVMRPLGGDI